MAYGSNTDPALLARHLPGPTPPHHPLDLDHPRWFGGRSRRWAGGVAFLGLAPAAGVTTACRAYLVDEPGLAAIFASENLVAGAWPGLEGLAPGQHRRAGMPLSADGTRGKYDAVLRLPDVEGGPAYTVTTARRLHPRPPDPAYAAAIEGAIQRRVRD
ncbi:hypothetical protein GCM10027418_01170 [Mariniluteicoccus endophyticus]